MVCMVFMKLCMDCIDVRFILRIEYWFGFFNFFMVVWLCVGLCIVNIICYDVL